jgi:hypothetical protein
LKTCLSSTERKSVSPLNPSLVTIDNEKRDWLEQLSLVKQQNEKVRMKEVETESRKAQIADFQRGLSETHMQIFDERRQLLQLEKDNQILSKIEEEDKRKI